MAYKYKLKEIEVGDTKVTGGVKSVVTDKDPETGAITWSVDYVPNLTKLVEDSMELAATAKGVYQKTKDDKKFLDIYEQAKQLRNTIRTHVRNNYPSDYKKAIFEETDLSHHMQLGDDWGEVIFYLEKYGTDKEIDAYITAFKEQAGPHFDDSNFDHVKEFQKWVKTAMRADEIDEATGIDGDVIDLNPANKTKLSNYVKLPHHLAAALLDISDEMMDKEAGTISSQPQIKQALALLKKAAEKAMTGEKAVDEASTSGGAGAYQTPYAFKMKKKKVKEGVGATLGPGPKAGPEGVTNNAYTKQFKYKLVPKNKKGNYTQKGSGMIVKDLF